MSPVLRCACGKILTDHNVCPLPSGRGCEGPDVIVRPRHDLEKLRKGIVAPYEPETAEVKVVEKEMAEPEVKPKTKPKKMPLTIDPDLAARKLIVAAYLYYVLDSPTISDHEYDQLSVYVSQHFKKLNKIRQWQLGSANDIYSGGSHIKFTVMAVNAAREMYREANGSDPELPSPEEWKEEKFSGITLRYVTAV